MGQKTERKEEFRFGRALQMANVRFRRLADENLSKYNISVSQLRILAYLSRKEGPVFQRELEEEFGIRRSSITELLQNMEKSGYLKRENSPQDGRIKTLFLTPEGQKLDRELKMYLHNLEKMMMEGIPPEEKQVFQKTILKMIENLEQIERSRE